VGTKVPVCHRCKIAFDSWQEYNNHVHQEISTMISPAALAWIESESRKTPPRPDLRTPRRNTVLPAKPDEFIFDPKLMEGMWMS